LLSSCAIERSAAARPIKLIEAKPTLDQLWPRYWRMCRTRTTIKPSSTKATTIFFAVVIVRRVTQPKSQV
jgi:hypothetical protein